MKMSKYYQIMIIIKTYLTQKSPVDWDKFVNPVNRLVHPSGLKNFADTSILLLQKLEQEKR